jgi:hypothetical protein
MSSLLLGFLIGFSIGSMVTVLVIYAGYNWNQLKNKRG